jgi:hypothetical protein
MTSLATVLPRSGDPGLAEECPAYKSAVSADMLRPRASRFMTEDACHLPPRGLDAKNTVATTVDALSSEVIWQRNHAGPKPFGFALGVTIQTVRLGLAKP